MKGFFEIKINGFFLSFYFGRLNKGAIFAPALGTIW